MAQLANRLLCHGNAQVFVPKPAYKMLGVVVHTCNPCSLLAGQPSNLANERPFLQNKGGQCLRNPTEVVFCSVPS